MNQKQNILSASIKNIYLAGIGGIGVSGLALLLKDKGYTVSGSDICENYTIQDLRKEGIVVNIGHREENLPERVDLLAYSSAIKENNPEIIEAKKRGITILKRGELLGLLSWDRKTIAVSGSHGKTTTTSMIGYLLRELGYDPTVFVGGLPLNSAKNAWWGGKEYFVIETDESDGSFLYYNPLVSVITNIDHEHLDYYKNFENLKNSFLKFAYQTTGMVIGCGDDENVREIIKQVNGWTYGWSLDNKFCVTNFSFDGQYSCFSLYMDKKLAGSVKISLLGRHNALNAASALAFMCYLDIDMRKAIEAIKSFKGTKRRFQVKSKVGGVTFVDDYGHHPTEIRAVIDAARALNPKRLFIIWQPHRYSRVNALFEEFSRCFGQADMVVMTDIYSASESEILGLTPEFLLKKLQQNFSGKSCYVSKNALTRDIPEMLCGGDLVVGLGAGDINFILENIAVEYKNLIDNL